MMMRRKRPSGGPCVGRFLLRLTLFFPLLFLAVLPVHAQEIVDPRSGGLLLTVTDLVLPAGPITLELSRTLEPQETDRGLLGKSWRLNWESLVVSQGSLMLIKEAPYPVAFVTGTTPGYTSGTGDRLVIERDGRVVRTKLDGTREIFDVQGRLVERDYRNGNKAIVRYGADGRIARIDGPKGSFIQFSADNQGRVTHIETSTGASVRYAYVGNALAEVQVNGGPVVRYGYDTSGALTRIHNPRSGPVELAYDAYQRVVSRRWADGAEERFEYDDAARAQRRIDPAGAVTVTRFDEDGRRAEVIDPRGGKNVIAFDANGRAESVTGPSGETAKTIYDALGRPAAFHDPYGQITHYEYLGATGRVKTIARPDGTQESLAYDPQQNVTEIKLGPQPLATLAYHPDGTVSAAKALGVAEQRLTYDGQARLQTLTNPLGERLQWSYDARGNPLRAVNPLGGVTAWQWNAQGQLVAETDPTGATTRLEYDSSGRLARVIDPLGRVTRLEYDVRGRLVAETDPSGQVTRYAYDRAGRLAKLSEGGESEGFRYDAAGNLIEWVGRLGRKVQLEYDALGRVTRERWSTGLQVHYRYDARGRVSAIEDSAGSKREWQHDERGQIIAMSNALGAITQFQYDVLGNITARRDALGNIKQFGYTADGVLARVQEPSGDAAEYLYDAAYRLVELVRPSGGTSRFTYNALGQLTREVDPLGNERRHEYDVAGRLVATTDATGRTTRYTYDAAGRLTEKRLPNNTRVTFKYDSVGNLLEADDGAFPVRYQYDREGRLAKVEYPAIKKAVAYQYDAAGLCTKLILPDARVTRYEYNAHKQLAAIIPPDGKRIALAYDTQQRLQSIVYPNGIRGRWGYDATGRVTKLDYVDRIGKPIGAWTYHYDPDGNLLQQQAQGRSTTYAYDGAGQLIEAAAPASVVRYRYGRGGSRVAMEAGASVTHYRHDGADRLVGAGDEKLTYDANGNLVRREGPAGTTSYEYDAEDRLVKVQLPDGATTTFGYAPTGERVWKRDAAGIAYYLYDGLDLILELDEKGHGKAAYAHGPGVDQPLAMLRDGRTYYYHADRLGSIRLLTDDQGQVAAAYDYDAFGKLSVYQGAVPNPFTFTGREWDASTGLYYYRARYYDPDLGRFLSVDPLSAALDEPLEHNPYLYVRNQPLRFIDPLGLSSNNPYAVYSTDDLVQRKKTLDDLQWRRIRAQMNTTERSFNLNYPLDKGRLRRLDRMGDKLEAAVKPIDAELKSRGYVPPPREAPQPRHAARWYAAWEKKYLDPAKLAADMDAFVEAEAAAAARSEAIASGRTRTPTQKVPVAGGTQRAGTSQVPVPVEGGAAAAAAEGGAAAGLRGRLPSAGTVAKVGGAILLQPALEATVAAVQAEPGQRLEAAGNSLANSGRGLLESGKQVACYAAAGAAIGACTPVPGGAAIGAGIGAAVPIVKGTVETLVEIPKVIGAIKEELKKFPEGPPLPPEGLGGRGPSSEGPPPPRAEPPAGPFVGPITGGLPGAPPPGGMADYDPTDKTKDPGMPTGTRDQTARAGRQTDPSAEGTPPGEQRDRGKGPLQPDAYKKTPGPPAGKGPKEPVPPTYDPSSDPTSTETPSVAVQPGTRAPGPQAQTAPGATPGVTAQKPPVQTPPPTAQAPPAAGKECDPPLCRELCEFSGGSKCTTPDCSSAVIRANSTCVGNECRLDSSKVYKACYDNMLRRCQQGQAGGTGGWCVGPGADRTCEARAQRVCGLR